MSRDDTVAVVLDGQLARTALIGECLSREVWSAAVENEQAAMEPHVNSVVLILKRDSVGDGQAIANALVIALGVLPRAMVIDADAPVPEGFARDHFVEVGEDVTRNTRGQMVYEIIPPVRFCD